MKERRGRLSRVVGHDGVGISGRKKNNTERSKTLVHHLHGMWLKLDRGVPIELGKARDPRRVC